MYDVVVEGTTRNHVFPSIWYWGSPIYSVRHTLVPIKPLENSRSHFHLTAFVHPLESFEVDDATSTMHSGDEDSIRFGRVPLDAPDTTPDVEGTNRLTRGASIEDSEDGIVPRTSVSGILRRTCRVRTILRRRGVGVGDETGSP